MLAACWAHVFRKFEEAAPGHPDAQTALALIGELYEIDARAGADVQRRAELRRTESAERLDKLNAWLWSQSQAVMKMLSIGKAAAYAIGNWERLTRFIENPLVPLGNNATERAIRGPVVGRKNHYGSKSRRGTEVAAILYSLVETAKLHDVDPAQYCSKPSALLTAVNPLSVAAHRGRDRESRDRQDGGVARAVANLLQVADGGSNSLQWWRRLQPIRTAAEVELEFVVFTSGRFGYIGLLRRRTRCGVLGCRCERSAPDSALTRRPCASR